MSTENKTPKIDISMARVEFDRFVEAMDIDVDESIMDSEDLTSFNKAKNALIRAVMKGSLVFNEKGEAEYTPCHPDSKHSKTLTFHERSGASLMAMDGKKKGHDMAKAFAVMAETCRVHQSAFAGLVGADDKVCRTIFTLLMD